MYVRERLVDDPMFCQWCEPPSDRASHVVQSFNLSVPICTACLVELITACSRVPVSAVNGHESAVPA